VVCILAICLPVMLSVAMVIYVDRKIWAAMALRRGPNVVGPFGLLQSFADGLKVFLQRLSFPPRPTRACPDRPHRHLHGGAAGLGVILFNSGAMLADINVACSIFWRSPRWGLRHDHGRLGFELKDPFFSAMRASAQMISYEVSIGFIGLRGWAGSFNMNTIVLAQKAHVLGFSTALPSTRCSSRSG
jgi:NADH-quinone oxidoreductase subunit H